MPQCSRFATGRRLWDGLPQCRTAPLPHIATWQGHGQRPEQASGCWLPRQGPTNRPNLIRQCPATPGNAWQRLATPGNAWRLGWPATREGAWEPRVRGIAGRRGRQPSRGEQVRAGAMGVPKGQSFEAEGEARRGGAGQGVAERCCPRRGPLRTRYPAGEAADRPEQGDTHIFGALGGGGWGWGSGSGWMARISDLPGQCQGISEYPLPLCSLLDARHREGWPAAKPAINQ
jgi:hypothetical protein